MIHPQRIYQLSNSTAQPGPVIYWMQRDQRVEDNWALLYSRDKAAESEQPMAVVFCLASGFLAASEAHFRFMMAGLSEVATELRNLNIPFFLLQGDAGQSLPGFLLQSRAGCLVADFNPIKPVSRWKEKVLSEIHLPAYEVDAHNILPCREISPKAEFSAMHLRNRISRRLQEFLVDFPLVRPLPESNLAYPWNQHGLVPTAETADVRVFGYKPGARAARQHLKQFLHEGLKGYNDLRNDPTLHGQSGLSPYLHFGQISAQRIALEVSSREGATESRKSFLEELIVRRELADNFCHYNQHYDSTEGFHDWAKRTLNVHRCDPRQYLYTFDQFRNAETHDTLWNAAQKELAGKGRMHGFMRMYWAKKILEWTTSPEEAMEVAISLNDRYSLDGRDPNGYAGIAWSIGGVHDRAWGERPVFGKIRYMNFQGCKRKFDVEEYIRQNP